MGSWAVFLRGINVGGHGTLAMADLRAKLPDIGARDIATYIQSGNLIFHHDATEAAALAEAVEGLIESHFGFRPHAVALRAETLSALVETLNTTFQNAAATQGEVEAKNVHVYLSFNNIDKMEYTPLLQYCTRGETLHSFDGTLVVHAPQGIGRSKLANPLEKLLDGRATARNLNTLRKVQERLKGKSV